MSQKHARCLSLASGDPWNLSCTVESIGPDYLCRLHGGAPHIGAVAVSAWRGERAFTERVVLPGHREAGTAAHAAHRLCRATRRNVTCIAGIHFDSIDRKQIDEIVQTSFDLARRAAREMEDRRLRREILSECPVYSEIVSSAHGAVSRLDRFFDTPLVELIDQVRPALREARRTRREVRIFAPLYLSNACLNDCVYCGFRRSYRIRRTGLGQEQIIAEARHLAGQGHRTIDLVTGEVPTDSFVDQVCRAVELILAGSEIRQINLNLGALTLEQYRRLRSAGAVGYHLYQETYDPETYFEVHRSGPKREMAYRLEAPQRAIEAGFERIGLGVLLGLRPVRLDLARLARHARSLGEAHPHVRLGFSLPRIRSVSGGGYIPPSPVSDEELVKAMLFLRVSFPKADLTVTTRESSALRDQLLLLGVSKLSAGVSTAPGGYTGAREAQAQFLIADERSVNDVANAVRHAGLTPTFG